MNYGLSPKGLEYMFGDDFINMEHTQQCIMLIAYAADQVGLVVTDEMVVTCFNENYMGFLTPEETVEWRDALKDNEEECKRLLEPMLKSYN